MDRNLKQQSERMMHIIVFAVPLAFVFVVLGILFVSVVDYDWLKLGVVVAGVVGAVTGAIVGLDLWTRRQKVL